jgi:hypothetical protein
LAQLKYISELYQKKYNALGIVIQCKKGKHTSVVKINWKYHLMNDEDESENSELDKSESSD